MDKDYAISKFDRGHQAPSDDFKADKEWMVESFFLSNIVPQIGAGFNRDHLKNFETMCARSCAAGRTLCHHRAGLSHRRRRWLFHHLPEAEHRGR